MVTREERDTTRGRAHALWEMLQGNVIDGGWRDEGVKQALDLCLACKGCKGDCPVNVDIATYKAEFLSHYWEGRMRPRFAYAFGWIDKWAQVASLAPGLVNLSTQIPLLRQAAKWIAGIPSERTIPAFAAVTFKSWFSKRTESRQGGERVILWADTFNNHFFPETAIAATEVLEAAGCDVVVPQQHLCCGRPLYDYGFLDMAEQYLRRILDALGPEIDRGTPMVVLEPSCCSVFRDELCNLFPHDKRAQKLRAQTLTMAEFLAKKKEYQPPKFRKKALVHGHCHHKALLRFGDEEALLKTMDLQYEFIPAGCCGMAGSFGFENDKYDISVKIGERALLPAVRKADRDTIVIADGFSCKEQVAQLTDRQPLHIAQVLAMAMRNPDLGEKYPEHRMVQAREEAQRRSMVNAAAISGMVLAGVGAFAYAMRNSRKRKWELT